MKESGDLANRKLVEVAQHQREALIWEKVAFQGAKPESPHIINLRWDQRIAYNIGWQARGRPLWLVTDDNDFARAAAAAGLGDRVHTLEAYERWLGGA